MAPNGLGLRVVLDPCLAVDGCKTQGDSQLLVARNIDNHCKYL